MKTPICRAGPNQLSASSTKISSATDHLGLHASVADPHALPIFNEKKWITVQCSWYIEIHCAILEHRSSCRWHCLTLPSSCFPTRWQTRIPFWPQNPHRCLWAPWSNGKIYLMWRHTSYSRRNDRRPVTWCVAIRRPLRSWGSESGASHNDYEWFIASKKHYD